MSVQMIEAKFLLLEVSNTTLSPSIWQIKSVHQHITKAKILLLKVTTTTLSPSFWHHDVSRHDWGQVSTARGLYYYIESQYLTQEVNTHHWGQVPTANDLYYYIESQYLTHEVSTHSWGQVSTARGQYCYITTLNLSIWHIKSVHITEAKVLLLEVSSTTLRPSIWHN